MNIVFHLLELQERKQTKQKPFLAKLGNLTLMGNGNERYGKEMQQSEVAYRREKLQLSRAPWSLFLGRRLGNTFLFIILGTVSAPSLTDPHNDPVDRFFSFQLTHFTDENSLQRWSQNSN